MIWLFAPLLLGILAAIAWIDAREQRIPDGLNAALAATGLLAAAVSGTFVGQMLLAVALLLGFWAVRERHRVLTGRIGLGLGDVKLCAAWASALPLMAVANAVTLAAVATLAVIALRWRSKGKGLAEQPVPFGAALAPALFLVWAVRGFVT